VLIGTPFLAWYLRLLGAKIGRRTCLETPFLSEFDLVTIGDDTAVGFEATLQTHLFEDRIMKLAPVSIGAGCSLDARSVALYDGVMEDGSSLGPLSLLMKGETFAAGTRWVGIPARRA
jgi:non-ribosomal peptide synthetase-like protein